MLNVLIISPTGGYAGIDVCLESLVMGLDKKRFNPIVVFPEKSILRDTFEDQGIKCYTLPLNWWFPIGYSGNDIIHVLPTLRKKVEPLIHIIQDNNIDMVLTNTTINMDGVIASQMTNTPHIFYMHAQYAPNIYKHMPEETRRFLYEFMGRSSQKVICCSKLLKEFMDDYISNALYIHNGVDIEKFKFNKRELNEKRDLKMVCVGHYNQNKQQDFVIRALRNLKIKDYEILKQLKFHMVGPGEQEYTISLKKMVKDFGLEEQVVFEDFRSDIHDYLNEFNLYINSSITENFPVSVIEAMSNGMPVLATINDGTIQIVEQGKSGFLVETPDEMADRIIEFYNNPRLMEEMSFAARQKVERNFTNTLFIKQFEAVFEDVNRQNITNADDTKFISNLYETFVNYDYSTKSKLKVLMIYPKEASATYAIAGKMPLEYLRSRNKVEYVEVTEQEYDEKYLDECDVVYCVRYYHTFAHNVLREASNRGKRFVWYIDDNYYALKVKDGDVIHEKTKNEFFDVMFKESHAVIVNNDELYRAGVALESTVYRLPTYQTIEELPEKRKVKDKIRFGFMGTLKRDGDFDCVVDAIEEIQNKYEDRIEIDFIGYIPDKLKKYQNVKHFEFMSDYEFFRIFFRERAWDFGLAPLKDTHFNRSKTNNKYREYSANGIAGIYSNISTYSNSVKQNETGILVDNDKDSWYSAIEIMITDDEKRKSIGVKAYQDIKENYNIEKFCTPLYRVFVNSEFQFKHAQEKIEWYVSKPARVVNSEQLSLTLLNGTRKYNVCLDSDTVYGIGILLTSYDDEVTGELLMNIWMKGILLGSSTLNLEKIDRNQWNYFEFSPIHNCRGKIVTIELVSENTHGTIGVFEDRLKRSFLFRLFNKLKCPLKGMDVLFIDVRG